MTITICTCTKKARAVYRTQKVAMNNGKADAIPGLRSFRKSTQNQLSAHPPDLLTDFRWPREKSSHEKVLEKMTRRKLDLYFRSEPIVQFAKTI